MIKYGKLKNGNLILAPKKVKIDKEVIFNPKGDILTNLGYKIVTENVVEHEEGKIYSYVWAEDDEHIYKIWSSEDVPNEEATVNEVITIEDRISILEEAFMELTEMVLGEE